MVKQMKDIQYKIDELFDELEETNLYKIYVKIKKQLKEDKDINNLINEIRRYQKIATNNKDESVENKIKELYKKLESYTIYQSQLNIKEELESELYIIKENFELYFKKLLEIHHQYNNIKLCANKLKCKYIYILIIKKQKKLLFYVYHFIIHFFIKQIGDVFD